MELKNKLLIGLLMATQASGIMATGKDIAYSTQPNNEQASQRAIQMAEVEQQLKNKTKEHNRIKSKKVTQTAPVKQKWFESVIKQLSPELQNKYSELNANRGKSKKDRDAYNNFWKTVIIPKMNTIWSNQAAIASQKSTNRTISPKNQNSKDSAYREPQANMNKSPKQPLPNDQGNRNGLSQEPQDAYAGNFTEWLIPQRQ
jgi:hypothetical protein